MKIATLFTILLASCVMRDGPAADKAVRRNEEEIKFKGSLHSLPRASPWDVTRVEYRNGLRKVAVTNVPIEPKIMNEILNSSNFRPSAAMMQEIAKLYYQGSNSRCPDGDDFSLKKSGGVTVCEVNAVDRSGCLWRLKVESEDGIHRFGSKKTQKSYANLFKF